MLHIIELTVPLLMQGILTTIEISVRLFWQQSSA